MKDMMNVVDKETVKEALRELIREEPDAFKAILKEIFNKNPSEEEEFDQLLSRNFKQYGETFRALA